MNKRHRKLQKHRELFLFKCEGSCREYDTYNGFTIIARDETHALHLLLSSTSHENIHNFTEEQIIEAVEDCLMYGLPILPKWRKYMTPEVIKDSCNEPAAWSFTKVSKVPGITRPEILGTSYLNG